MGRVKDQTPAAAQPPSKLKHFTHPHDLYPLPFHSPQTLCSGCKLQSSGTMYTCTPCAFTLHQSCATLPQLITHLSHRGCTLSLLPLSSYPGGLFSCNACTRRSDSWNYHCAACEYDLHVSCASKPIKIRHPSHATCELELTFHNPYPNSTGFSCDICGKIGSKQWLYRCRSCDFDAHLDCTAVQQPLLQHQNSAPPVYQGQFPGSPHAQLLHSASSGAIQNQHAANLYNQGPINAGQPYGSLAGNPQMMMQNNQQAGGLGGNLMAAALQGFVEGAFQGVGQAVVQEVIADGGGSGGGGDGGGGDMYSY